MVTRNVVLTETQGQLDQALVASSRHQNVSEVMWAGLQLLKQDESQITDYRQGLLEGLAQAKAAAKTLSGGPFETYAAPYERNLSADAPRRGGTRRDCRKVLNHIGYAAERPL